VCGNDKTSERPDILFYQSWLATEPHETDQRSVTQHSSGRWRRAQPRQITHNSSTKTRDVHCRQRSATVRQPQCQATINIGITYWKTNHGRNHHTTTVLRPFFWDHPSEPVPEENFWTLWCKGGLTEADTLTIRRRATPSGLTSAHLHRPPIFLQAGCPSCHPTNSVKALKARA